MTVMLLFHVSCLLLCLPSALGAKGGAAGRNQVLRGGGRGRGTGNRGSGFPGSAGYPGEEGMEVAGHPGRKVKRPFCNDICQYKIYMMEKPNLTTTKPCVGLCHLRKMQKVAADSSLQRLQDQRQQNKVCVGVCFLARQVIEKKRKEALTRKMELGIPVEDPSSGGFGSGGYLGSGGYSGSGGNLEY